MSTPTKRIFNRHDQANARTDAKTIHARANALARARVQPSSGRNSERVGFANQRTAAPVAVPRKQFISPVHGKSFDARTARGTFLLNLHKNHRDLAQRVAAAHNVEFDFRNDAKKTDGTPDPNRYAVHVVNGPYDREALLAAISDAILQAWTARQNQNAQ